MTEPSDQLKTLGKGSLLPRVRILTARALLGIQEAWEDPQGRSRASEGIRGTQVRIRLLWRAEVGVQSGVEMLPSVGLLWSWDKGLSGPKMSYRLSLGRWFSMRLG